MVEAHRNMLDGLEQWRQQDVVLLSMTNAVDYDQVLLSTWVFTILLANFNTNQEAYAQLLEEMVKEKQEVLADLAQKARAFRYILAT